MKINRILPVLFLSFLAFAANAQPNIPPDYILVKGIWDAQGSSGTLELLVDSIDVPTKGYLSKSGGSCFSVRKEVVLRKTVEGFSFETDMGGRCRMSKFTLIGPDEKKKYRGTFEGWAGTSDLDLSLVPK